MAQILTENEKVISVLEQAQALFAKHGGAVGYFSKDDKICALRALFSATGNYAQQVCYKSSAILDQIARENYEIPAERRAIVYVNDYIGMDAVNHCYDLAVKQAKEDIDG